MAFRRAGVMREEERGNHEDDACDKEACDDPLVPVPFRRERVLRLDLIGLLFEPELRHNRLDRKRV